MTIGKWAPPRSTTARSRSSTPTSPAISMPSNPAPPSSASSWTFVSVRVRSASPGVGIGLLHQHAVAQRHPVVATEVGEAPVDREVLVPGPGTVDPDGDRVEDLLDRQGEEQVERAGASAAGRIDPVPELRARP